MGHLNFKKTIVKPDQLPLHCPQSKEVWNLHPRVFLPIKPKQDFRCPYCSTVYRLDGTPKKHHY